MNMRIGYRTYTCTDKWEFVGAGVLQLVRITSLHIHLYGQVGACWGWCP